MNEKLLTRDEFRNAVFERDKYKCVICSSEGVLDAHHIIERRLFGNGGYFISNGATLCGVCHINAETTDLSCEEIRKAAGIKTVIIPDDYYKDHIYTKWGDVVLPNGSRMKGPLFEDDSVQKILKLGNQYHLYTDYVKYPRTYHLPHSEGKTDDDRTLTDTKHFEGKEIVILEKMDGENATLYSNGYHARSIDGRDHWSRSYIKNLQAQIGYEIPKGWRICCENLYAKHSIKYTDLESYVLAFSVWDERNICLSWEETVSYLEILGLKHPRVLYRGMWNEKIVKDLYSKYDRDKVEGYVVRLAHEFSYNDFKKSVAKFVRKEHVNTSHHWFFTATEKNELEK